jgi:hypothetical protein
VFSQHLFWSCFCPERHASLPSSTGKYMVSWLILNARWILLATSHVSQHMDLVVHDAHFTAYGECRLIMQCFFPV